MNPIDYPQLFANIATTVVPIGALFGWLWHRLDKKFEKIDERFDKMDQKIDERVSYLDYKMEKRFFETDQKMETGFKEAKAEREKLEQKMEAGFKEAKNERDKLEQRMETGFKEAKEERRHMIDDLKNIRAYVDMRCGDMDTRMFMLTHKPPLPPEPISEYPPRRGRPPKSASGGSYEQ